MKRSGLQTVVSITFVFIVALSAAWLIEAQEAKSPYPGMASVDQYLMDRNAEIALARSAAPESISRDAEVMVLGRKGYEIAVQGRNVIDVARGQGRGLVGRRRPGRLQGRGRGAGVAAVGQAQAVERGVADIARHLRQAIGEG